MTPRSLASWIVVAVVLLGVSRGATVNAQPTASSISRATPKQPQNPLARRVWGDTLSSRHYFGGPSPDGSLISFSDGNLAVRDLATGQERRLANVSKGSAESAYESVFSRDGRQIAYVWDPDTIPGYQVRVIGTDGSSPRVVFRAANNDAYAQPTDWTPDGRFVVAIGATADKTGQILLIPSAGGSPRIIKSFPPDWRIPKQVKVSQDGKYLAYDYPPRKDAVRREIFILPLDGGHESTVVKDANDNRLVGWTPDGARLVFMSERGGSPGLWTLRVENGNARGEPALVRKDLWRSVPVGISANGSVFYQVHTGDEDVFVASVDAASGKILGRPQGITQRPGENYGAPSVSPDGRSIAYLTHTAPDANSSRPRGGETIITVQSLQGGERRTLHPKLTNIRGARPLEWSRDGKFLLIRAADDRGRQVPFELSLKTGEASPLDTSVATVARAKYLGVLVSPDGKWRYTLPGPRGQANRIVASLVSGRGERELFVAPDSMRIGGLILSPDGHTLVFSMSAKADQGLLQPRRMWVLNVDGGAPRLLFPPAAEPARPVQPEGFTAEGRYVVYAVLGSVSLGAVPSGFGFWSIPLIGGEPTQLLDLGDGSAPPTVAFFTTVRVSPDGKRLVFVGGKRSSELWVLEDPALGFRTAPAASLRK